MPDFKLALLRAQNEILDDITRGIVPKRLRSFEELHKYVDANTYGGLTDETAWRGIPHDEKVAFANRLQEAIDRWIRAGMPEPREYV